MRIRLTEAVNTPLRFIAAGEVVDLPDDEARARISEGTAEPATPAKQERKKADAR